LQGFRTHEQDSLFVNPALSFSEPASFSIPAAARSSIVVPGQGSPVSASDTASHRGGNKADPRGHYAPPKGTASALARRKARLREHEEVNL